MTKKQKYMLRYYEEHEERRIKAKRYYAEHAEEIRSKQRERYWRKRREAEAGNVDL